MVKCVLTLHGTALHDVEQLCDIALHSCGVGLVDYFPPAADLDGTFLLFFELVFVSLMSFYSFLQGVPQKQKLQLDGVRKLADYARNYHEYRSRLRATVPPAVPFLGECSALRLCCGLTPCI